MPAPLTIDQSTCIQCGTCVAVYPELFETDPSDGTVHVKADADFTGKNLEEIKKTCPNNAIVDADPKDTKPSA